MNDITSKLYRGIAEIISSRVLLWRNTKIEVVMVVKMRVLVWVDQGRALQNASVGIGTTAAATAAVAQAQAAK